MKKIAGMLLSLCLVALLEPVALAATDPQMAEVAEEVEAAVTVESVDVANRMLTVRDKAGTMQTVQVPDTVKNLKQVKKGDKLVVRYREAMTAQIKKTGEGSGIVEKTESTTTAPPGAKPGAVAQTQTKATIKIKAVDPTKNTLTFTGPKGMERTITVKRPELQSYLKQLKPGDEVEVVYTEAMAIAVKPA